MRQYLSQKEDFLAYLINLGRHGGIFNSKYMYVDIYLFISIAIEIIRAKEPFKRKQHKIFVSQKPMKKHRHGLLSLCNSRAANNDIDSDSNSVPTVCKIDFLQATYCVGFYCYRN